MAKYNISFNNKNYSISDEALSAAKAELQQHLLTTMNGSGAVINFGGISYSIDSSKLSSATSDFVSHLSTIVGNGSKVVVNGVEYSFDTTKVQDAITDLETVLDSLRNTEDVDIVIVLDEAILDEHILE